MALTPPTIAAISPIHRANCERANTAKLDTIRTIPTMSHVHA
jgi:hypothetical protein